jgi:hypothetical protein
MAKGELLHHLEVGGLAQRQLQRQEEGHRAEVGEPVEQRRRHSPQQRVREPEDVGPELVSLVAVEPDDQPAAGAQGPDQLLHRQARELQMVDHPDREGDVERLPLRQVVETAALHLDSGKAVQDIARRGEGQLGVVDRQHPTRTVSGRPEAVATHSAAGVEHVPAREVLGPQRFDPAAELHLVVQEEAVVAVPLEAETLGGVEGGVGLHRLIPPGHGPAGSRRALPGGARGASG